MASIMVIDDDIQIRTFVREVLEAEGYDVVGEAEDGAAAIEAAQLASGKTPLKIRNSPMNPFRPGKPSEENMATLIHPQRSGVRCMRPPKSLRPREPRRSSSNPT